jgi:predicted HAD superfamily Cof-like phosphohydrolase
MKTMTDKQMQTMHGGVAPHERRVMAMMIGFGQNVPDGPTVASEKDRITRARLILEEALEYVAAAGLKVVVDNCDDNIAIDLDNPFGKGPGTLTISADGEATPDLTKIVDSLSDISVVNTGGFVTHGVRMTPMLELTDQNNLMKIANGKLDEHGKFQKHPSHPVPNYTFELRLQGYDSQYDEHLEGSAHNDVVNPIDEPVAPYVPVRTGNPVPAELLPVFPPKPTERTSSAEPNEAAVSKPTPFASGSSFEYWPELEKGNVLHCPAQNTIRPSKHDQYSLVYSGMLVDVILAAARQFHPGLLTALLGLGLKAAGYEKKISVDLNSARVTQAGEPGPRGVVFSYRRLE